MTGIPPLRLDRDTQEQLAADVVAALLTGTTADGARPRPPIHSNDDRNDDPPTSIDYVRSLAFFRWYDGLLRAHMATAGALTTGNLAGPRQADPLLALAEDAHRLLLAHPVAAQSMVKALVQEGRRLATTDEGAALKDRLGRSRRIQRAALLWRSVTMSLLLPDDAESALPSSYLDALFAAADRPELERLLGSLLLMRGEP